MSVLTNNQLVKSIEKNTIQGAKTQLEILTYNLENRIAWNIQNNENLIDLILRLYVVTIGDVQFELLNKKQLSETYKIVKQIVKTYGSDKIKCIRKAEEAFNVRFDLESFLSRKIENIIVE